MFQNNEYPGSDGLTREFYKVFLNDLLADLHAVYNEIANRGIMPESMRNRIIIYLHKKGDRRELKNWRPISLLNIDYKINTKIIVNRMSLSVEQIVNTCQTSSIPGRTILDNLSMTRDIIDKIHKENGKAFVVALDQEKAFDRLNWDFIFEVLKHFGYGPNLIRMIKAAYNQSQSQIKVNNYVSERFILRRGVRKGCPLSMLLYDCVHKCLEITLEQTKLLKAYL